jgi:hypothetical protein
VSASPGLYLATGEKRTVRRSLPHFIIIPSIRERFLPGWAWRAQRVEEEEAAFRIAVVEGGEPIQEPAPAAETSEEEPESEDDRSGSSEEDESRWVGRDVGDDEPPPLVGDSPSSSDRSTYGDSRADGVYIDESWSMSGDRPGRCPEEHRRFPTIPDRAETGPGEEEVEAEAEDVPTLRRVLDWEWEISKALISGLRMGCTRPPYWQRKAARAFEVGLALGEEFTAEAKAEQQEQSSGSGLNRDLGRSPVPPRRTGLEEAGTGRTLPAPTSSVPQGAQAKAPPAKASPAGLRAGPARPEEAAPGSHQEEVPQGGYGPLSAGSSGSHQSGPSGVPGSSAWVPDQTFWHPPGQNNGQWGLLPLHGESEDQHGDPQASPMERVLLARKCEGPPEGPDAAAARGRKIYAGFQKEEDRGVYLASWRVLKASKPAGFMAKGFPPSRTGELRARLWLWSHGHREAAQGPLSRLFP